MHEGEQRAWPAACTSCSIEVPSAVRHGILPFSCMLFSAETIGLSGVSEGFAGAKCSKANGDPLDALKSNEKSRVASRTGAFRTERASRPTGRLLGHFSSNRTCRRTSFARFAEESAVSPSSCAPALLSRSGALLFPLVFSFLASDKRRKQSISLVLSEFERWFSEFSLNNHENGTAHSEIDLGCDCIASRRSRQSPLSRRRFRRQENRLRN